MTLDEIKDRMLVVSRDRERAAKIKSDLKMDDDCFGKYYSDTADSCNMCNVICELDGQRDSMSGWCRKFILQFGGTDQQQTEAEDK
jgi:hypothetical protein